MIISSRSAASGRIRSASRGWRHSACLALLASHVIPAIVNLPMVLRVVWFAHAERWREHRRLAKITFPIWLFVSNTGVLVDCRLYVWNPPPTV